MEENNEVEVGRIEQFMNEVINYLYSKFDGIPDHLVQDVAAYIANRFGVALIDITVDQDQRYRRKLDQLDEQHRELCNKYFKLQAKGPDHDKLRKKECEIVKYKERCERLKSILIELGFVNLETMSKYGNGDNLSPNDMRWLMNMEEI